MQRPVSTALTALGIGLVVAVFVAMLALANGFVAALVKTGSSDNVLLLRRGADSELSSGIPRDAISIISASPHIATGADGRPLMSPETYIVLNIPRAGGDEFAVANVVARGVSDKAFEVRRNIKIIEGRRFASGQSEICVGSKLAGPFRERERRRRAALLATGTGTSSAASPPTARASSRRSGGRTSSSRACSAADASRTSRSVSRIPAAFDEAKRAFLADQRIQVDAHRESEFYASQSELLGNILRFLAIMITSIMAVGAVFGAVNTMYAAVSSRTPEIAVLLTLGFQPRSVLASFLVESAVIALIGGVIGCLLALPINGVVTSTTNWASFSEIAFAFRVTPQLLLAGIVFAVVMGVVGGFFPARRASKLPVIQALR